MRQPENNKYRDLALFLTLLMMLAFAALLVGGAIAGFIVMFGKEMMTWFK